jgi:hypothetical protein
MRFGLTAYGTVYAMGIHPAANRNRITAKELLQMAESYGLQGSEIPFDILKSSDADEAAEFARDKGLFINVAAGGFDPVQLKEAMQMADRVGALSVRTVVGGGEVRRGPQAYGWLMAAFLAIHTSFFSRSDGYGKPCWS